MKVRNYGSERPNPRERDRRFESGSLQRRVHANQVRLGRSRPNRIAFGPHNPLAEHGDAVFLMCTLARSP